MTTEHRVYWTITHLVHPSTTNGETINEPLAHSKDFKKGELGLALKFCEELRHRRLTGEPISFITCADEISGCTSLSGVAAPASDYDWKKRR